MSLDYNTSRKKLVLPEYGRNVHKMVDFAMSIEDRQERNRVARAIVQILGSMNPHLRDVQEFKHKLWDHLALMSNFEIDIDYPHDPIKAEDLLTKPNRIPYSTGRIRYRHYGRTVEKLIKKACEYEEGDEKNALLNLIANHMKKLYLTWNRESVSNDHIIEDIKELSEGKLDASSVKLTETREILHRNKRTTSNQNTSQNTGSGKKHHHKRR